MPIHNNELLSKVQKELTFFQGQKHGLPSLRLTSRHDHELSARESTTNVILMLLIKAAELSYPSLETQFHHALDHCLKACFRFSFFCDCHVFYQTF